jgi:hypothetical protein
MTPTQHPADPATPNRRVGLRFPTPPASGLLLPANDAPAPDPLWAATAATNFLGPTAPSPDREALAASLNAWITYQHAAEPAALFVCIAPGATTVHAILELEYIEDAGPELLNIGTLITDLRTPGAHTITGPDVTTLELPQGPAVRVNWFRTATPVATADSRPTADPITSQPALVEEQLAIVIPFPATRVTAVVTGTWPTLAASEELAALVETVASEITITLT